MKKQLLLLFWLTILTLPVLAQEFRFGVKGGANYADINGKNLDENSHRYKLGWHAGAIMNIQYPGNTWFSIQPEVLYSRKGYESFSEETEIKDNQGNLQFTEQRGGLVRFNYIEVPVLLNFKSGIIIFEFGPQFSYLVGYRNDAFIRTNYGSGEVITTDDEFRRFDEDRLRSIDLGLATGFRLQTHNGVGMGLRFNQGFIKLDNGDPTAGIVPRAPTATNQVFQLFVSYLIPE